MNGNWFSGLLAKQGKTIPNASPATVQQRSGQSFLIGASHIGAIRRGQQENGLAKNMKIASLGASRVSKSPFHAVVDGQIRFTDAGYQRNFETSGIAAGLSPGDTLGVQLGDTNTILLENGRYWAKHEPAVMCDADRVPVPHTTLLAICETQMAPVLHFMADLKALGYHLYWVPYPPVKADHPMFKGKVRPEVVAYLDQFFLSQIQSAMADMDIPCIARPAEATNDAGLLKPAYSQPVTGAGAEDLVHANPAYGVLMLREILAIV